MAQKILEKIKQIARNEFEEIGAAEILMPILTPKEL